jgi:hypothetical protein
MLAVVRRFLASCSLSGILILSSAVLGDDGGEGGDALPRMPGQWNPVPDTGSPSVLPALFGRETHRPAVQTQPGPDGKPAVVVSVYEKPALYGLTSSPDGRRLTALAYADTIDSQELMPLYDDPGLGDPLGLAFDPLGNTLYTMFVSFWPDYSRFSCCTINTETGQCICGELPSQEAAYVGLAFDSGRGRLFTVMLRTEGQFVCELSPDYYPIWQDALPPVSGSYTITDLAIDSQNGILYVLSSDDTSACRLVVYHLDSGLTRTIDLTGPYSTEPYKAAFDPCSGELLFLGRSGDSLYSMDPAHESAPRLVGLIQSSAPNAITFWRPESWGLDYAALDGVTWSREQIDNQQGSDWDPLWFWGGQRFHTCGSISDPELGRIDGTSFLYRDDGQLVVAWAQRVDNLFSEILVSARDPFTGAWNPLGGSAHGIPSNKLPGISSTFAFATDPKILLARMNGRDTLVVIWLERFDSPTSAGDLYARYFDEDAGQWLEMGLGCATENGLTGSGGKVDSFDAVVLPSGSPDGRRILLAYSQDIYDREPIFVRTWDDASQSWPEFSPGSAFSDFGISSPPVGAFDSHPTIAVGPDSGTIFIAWRRQTPAEPWQVLGKKRVVWEPYWVNVGYEGRIHRPAQTAATISHPTATFDKQFVVAWEQDLPTASGKREVLAKVWQDSVWQEIGAGSSTAGGLSGSYAAESVYPQLMTDPNRQPILAWDEGGEAYLRRFDQPLTQPGDCDGDGVPDDVVIADCFPPWLTWCNDCNENGVPDGCDIDTGYSWDINPSNGVPDECEQLALGDLNCNFDVDTDDIPHFVQALLDPQGYWKTHDGSLYPPCEWLLADMNGDSSIDGRDLAAFIDALLSP